MKVKAFGILGSLEVEINNKHIKEIKQTCTACPEQWEGKLDNGQYFYYRSRHEWTTFEIFDERYKLEGGNLICCPADDARISYNISIPDYMQREITPKAISEWVNNYFGRLKENEKLESFMKEK